MDDFEQLVNRAVEDEVIMGAVVVAKDRSGQVDYLQTFGNRCLKPEVKPMEKHTVLLLASMTKLMTTIAILKLVEQGLIKLDDDVTGLLPALAKQEILAGFKDDDSPITKKRARPITLRQLLTHSFGGAYDFHPEITKWKQNQGIPLGRGKTVADLFGTPLLHEPGEGWTYSGGLDWAGQIIEKLSGSNLEDYMKKHIWDPLGLKDMTFWPDVNPEVAQRLASMSIRDKATGKAVQSRKPIRLAPGVQDACGGQGAFGPVTDYIEILHSLLKDDERLLKRETTAMMFQPQLSPASRTALLAHMKHPDWIVGHFPDTGEYDWGLGGILIDGDKHPYRKRGTMIWSGNANLFWFIDRASGLCGVFGCQLLPPADVEIEQLIKAFEEEVHRRASSKARL
ncbi:beta-lactamase [Pseudomassariella vexata]|uniref:Beta-lactamase n=1 Tax=Pseudomassariella vexata TaxID=1141098 RepID=A0A1Y2DK68_9PEZI|nr:beta-lactamase [Pseudomassariella vexata]ORY59601.1 beta-lactamase [Pseudomassariella vexata]